MTREKVAWERALKPTGFASTTKQLAEALQIRCDGSHSHLNVVGGRAARAAQYLPELRKAICHGLREHLAYEAAGRLEATRARRARPTDDLATEVMYMMPSL